VYKDESGVVGIWHVLCWEIWREKNDCIFVKNISNVGVLVEHIKIMSWKLFLTSEINRVVVYTMS